MNPLDVAIQTAREAGALLLEHRELPLEAREKSARGDLVTAADRASEACIVERLQAATPHASILAEEGGGRTGTSDERWIVDPLDGTTNYAHGYPLYCVSIAYERAGTLLAAAIYAPEFDELYCAEHGSGATCNGRRLAVSGTQALTDALVCTGFMPANYERNGDRFARLSHLAQGVRRDGSAALDLAFVARGAFDAFWEFDLHAWDVAAGALCIREAGGMVTAIADQPFVLADGLANDAGSVLASNGKLHLAMQAALSVRKADPHGT